MYLFEIIFDFRLLTFILSVFIPTFCYWYFTKNDNYWIKRNLPYVKAPFLFGSFLPASKKSFEDLELERYKKYGKIYGIYEGKEPMLIITEPAVLKNIFIKDFQYFSTRRALNTTDPIHDKMLTLATGENWKRIRSIVSPTFSTGKIKKMIDIFQNCSKTLIQNFKMDSVKDESTDVLKNFGAFTMDVIASSAFSTKIDSHNDPENEFVKSAKGSSGHSFGIRFYLHLWMPKLMKLISVPPSTSNSVDFFKRTALEIIEKRKKTNQIRNDFLQLLLDTAKDEIEENPSTDKLDNYMTHCGDDSMNQSVLKTTTSKQLSMDEIVAQCIVFFLAGYHTTTVTLSLTSYLLAVSQDVQDKVFEEIEKVLNESNGELNYDCVQKLKYLDNVISEALRMYPPAIRLERTADADYKLEESGFTIPKGMRIGVPIYAMQRDPEYFPQPETFNPDRFNPKEKGEQVPFTYLPFGAGPRHCVGMRFALMEMKVCLIYILSVFKINICPENKKPLEFSMSTGLLKPKSVHLKIVPRESCPLKF